MVATLMITWDYDAAIGQVNASYPYKFDEQKIFQEIANVDRILELGALHQAPMTFACLGFAAEPGVYPYHVPDQIRSIFQAGHEIASHSWKHEWFPFLKRDQIFLSLERSKAALEACVQQPGCVKGFVPPFSRPMSWTAHGWISLGDRAWGPGYPGAETGSLLGIARKAGYSWYRVTTRSLRERLRPSVAAKLGKPWNHSHGMACVPQHYCGFDHSAVTLLEGAIQKNAPIVIVGHPSGLSRGREENIAHLQTFLEIAARYRDEGMLVISTVSGYLEKRNAQDGIAA